jgi:hypothetical protein
VTRRDVKNAQASSEESVEHELASEGRRVWVWMLSIESTSIIDTSMTGAKLGNGINFKCLEFLDATMSGGCDLDINGKKLTEGASS